MQRFGKGSCCFDAIHLVLLYFYVECECEIWRRTTVSIKRNICLCLFVMDSVSSSAVIIQLSEITYFAHEKIGVELNADNVNALRDLNRDEVLSATIAIAT